MTDNEFLTVKDIIEYFTYDTIIVFSDFNKEMTVREALADSKLCAYEVDLIRPLALNKIVIGVSI
jgi:hypothetical protein